MPVCFTNEQFKKIEEIAKKERHAKFKSRFRETSIRTLNQKILFMIL